jgi:hypothetical protein
MEFMDFPPRKKRRTIARHLMILAAVVMSLVAFGLAEDEVTGKAKLSDACGFTAIFLIAGYYIGWLPEIWEKTNRTAAERFVLPVFIAMILSYLYFGFRAYFIQPGVTGIIIFLQLFLLICLSCRIG